MVNCSQICKQILELDEAIRFAGIASTKGKILAAECREGMEPPLTTKEFELSVMHTVIRMGTRAALEEKLGRPVYAFALYEKVKRATIMTYGENGDKHAIIMVWLDREAYHDTIIVRKIMPYLRKIGKMVLG